MKGSILSGLLRISSLGYITILERRSEVFGFSFFLILSMLVPLTLARSGELNDPFSISNQNPFVNIFGLPRHRSSQVLTVGVSEFKIGYSVSSNYEFDVNELGDQIFLDGESEIWTFSYRRGVGNNWEAGLILPLIKHSGGYLDRTIIQWHDWFGMPQGGRDEGLIDELNYRVDIGGANRIMLNERVKRAGDVVLLVGKSFRSNINLRSELKIPTGNPKHLLGSGGIDFGLSFSYQRYLSADWIWGGMIALSYLSDSETGLINEDFILAASGHLVFRVKPRLALKLQWDLNSSPYSSISLDPFSKLGGVLAFGGTIKVSQRDRLDVIFTENLPNGETSPDFGFKLEFARRI